MTTGSLGHDPFLHLCLCSGWGTAWAALSLSLSHTLLWPHSQGPPLQNYPSVINSSLFMTPSSRPHPQGTLHCLVFLLFSHGTFSLPNSAGTSKNTPLCLQCSGCLVHTGTSLVKVLLMGNTKFGFSLLTAMKVQLEKGTSVPFGLCSSRQQDCQEEELNRSRGWGKGNSWGANPSFLSGFSLTAAQGLS